MPDLHAQAVHDALERRGVTNRWVDLQQLDRGLSLTEVVNGRRSEAIITTPEGARFSLSEVGTIWWRRPRAPAPDENLDDSARSFVRDEWRHLLEGLEAVVSTRWVNPPGAGRQADRQAVGLVAAAAHGLRVPRTVITNDADAVRALIADCGSVIYKRIGATQRLTATMPLRSEDVPRLDVLGNCPAIFQERIEARLDIRVTAIGDELHAAEIHSQDGDATLDWRLDHSVPFLPHRLEDDVADRLRGVMRDLGLLYGAIDLRLTPEGEYVFLEVNPSGQFLFVELLAGIPLSELMAEFLLCAERPREPVG